MTERTIGGEHLNKSFNPKRYNWELFDNRETLLIYKKGFFRLFYNKVECRWIIVYDAVFVYIPIFIGNIITNGEYVIIESCVEWDENKIKSIIKSLPEEIRK